MLRRETALHRNPGSQCPTAIRDRNGGLARNARAQTGAVSCPVHSRATTRIRADRPPHSGAAHTGRAAARPLSPSMQRSSLLWLAAALVAATSTWFAVRGSDAPPPAADPAGSHAPAPPAGDTAPAASHRSAVQGGEEAADDRSAGRCGFRGRLVDDRLRPLAHGAVSLCGAAVDAADAKTLATGTREDGTFAFAGLHPRGLYLLRAEAGGAAIHRLLPHAPGPGETVDLGDVVLPPAAAVSGTVVDGDGGPVAGALVRVVALPGRAWDLLPAAGMGALPALPGPAPAEPPPPWAASLLAQLPVATAHSAADGTFRLAGLAPCGHSLSIEAAGFATARASVAPAAGEEVALGNVALAAGADLRGLVVDARGAPVAGAEVLAADAAPAAPWRHLGRTGAEGRFAAGGFATGEVWLAARRGDGWPWFRAGPQPFAKEVRLVLPPHFAIAVRVVDPAGAPVRAPQLQIEGGPAGALRGAAVPIDLRGRTSARADGSVRVVDLPEGDYVVVAADGMAAPGRAEVRLRGEDAEVRIQLPAGIAHRVRVLGPGDVPVAGAAVHVQEHHVGREMPFLAGRTDAAGRLRLPPSDSEELTVSAEHPVWGVVHGRFAAGEGEAVLRLQEPGWIEGTLLAQGRPPAPGSHAVAVLHRPAIRGPLAALPQLAAPGPDGTFALRGLQPGRYCVVVLGPRPDPGSPAALLELARAPSATDRRPGREVEVLPGAGTRCELRPGPPDPEGARAQVHGTVRVDGSAAAGWTVSLRSGALRRDAEVDAAGRFDLGTVPAGGAQVRLLEAGADAETGESVWQRHLQLASGERRELAVAFATTSIAGTVLRPDGTPAAGVHVRAHALAATGPAADDGAGAGAGFRAVRTAADGAFRFARVPAGSYRLAAHGDERLRGGLAEVRAHGAGPVTGLRIELQPAVVVSGWVDTSALGRPAHLGLSFWTIDPAHRARRDRQVAWLMVQPDGTFATDELVPGTYLVRIHARLDGWREFDACEHFDVPPQGARGVLVRPVPRPPQQGAVGR